MYEDGLGKYGVRFGMAEEFTGEVALKSAAQAAVARSLVSPV